MPTPRYLHCVARPRQGAVVPGAAGAARLNKTLTFRPIGVLRTPFTRVSDCPRNPRQLDPAPVCEAHVLPEYVDGLASLGGFSHLIVLYWLNEAHERLVLTPPFDNSTRGVFATRAPSRPNPIGLSVTAFDGFADKLTLRLRYLDCLDGTPLLDIKPYLPSIDSVPDAATGWLSPHVGKLVTAAPGTPPPRD